MISDLLLVPRPRVMKIEGPGPRPGELYVRTAHEPALPAQGYELVIGSTGADLRYADEHGRSYAEQALRQITEQSTDRVPALRIWDHPDFPVRGYMLDISRDRVPTRDTLSRIVEVMSVARLNHLQLYTEHTFAYRDHAVVWQDASPITPEDIRWLDELCASQGIELAANQNSFGHMERWLRHDPYRYRAERPEGYEVMGMHREPSTLAPTPDNAEFAVTLLRELLDNFTSRRVNVGCDETFELGKGRSADAVAEQGKARVFADHLGRIASPLADDGYQVLFWADMIRSNPDLIADLPDGVRPVAWTYERPRTADDLPRIPEPVAQAIREVGIDVAAHMGFTGNVRPLADSGIPFWVAPGTSSWNSLVGRIDNALANIADAAEIGRKHGCEGLLLTDWGDNGHLQPLSVSFPPMLYAGAMSWCADANRDLDLSSVLDRCVFRDDAGVLSRVLDSVGRLWGRTGALAFNASPLQAALCPHQKLRVMGSPGEESVRAVISELDGALAGLGGNRAACADAEIVVRELTTAIRLARHGALCLLPDGRPGLDFADVVAEYRACWEARSRPGGLSDSLRHLQTWL